MDGVLIVRKPQGITSFGVVGKLRRTLGVRRAGHAGTLDPMAEGVLVLAFGEGTKLVPYLTAHDKVYLAQIAFGEETNTLDKEGVVVAVKQPSPRLLAALEAGHGAPLDTALHEERARKEQIPPQVSAIHVQGKRAYDLARRGIVVEMAPRAVTVHEITLERSAIAPVPSAWLRLRVGAGYYVRAFARDFARAMDTLGTLTALDRVQSGVFFIDEAVAIDAPASELRARMLSVSDVARRTLPRCPLDSAQIMHARAGRPFPLGDACPSGTPHAWFDESGALIAVGQTDAEGTARVVRGFTVPA